MADKFGKTKDGKQIVGRAVAEDNSGIIVQDGDEYEVRFSYPVDQRFIGYDHVHSDGDPIFIDVYDIRCKTLEEAVQKLKYHTGYADYERRGPGF